MNLYGNSKKGKMCGSRGMGTEGIREASSKMGVGFLELEMREGCFSNKEPHGQMLGGGKRKVYLFDKESNLARM